MELNTVKEAFVQVNENEEKDIFEELIRKSLRLGLLEALEKEVDSLCGKSTTLTNKTLITELEVKQAASMPTVKKKKSSDLVSANNKL